MKFNSLKYLIFLLDQRIKLKIAIFFKKMKYAIALSIHICIQFEKNVYLLQPLGYLTINLIQEKSIIFNINIVYK